MISHNLFKKTNEAGIIPIGSKGGLLESFKKKQNEDISGFDEDMMLPSMFQISKEKLNNNRGYKDFKLDGLKSIPGINFNFDSNQNDRNGTHTTKPHLFKGTTSNFIGKQGDDQQLNKNQ